MNIFILFTFLSNSPICLNNPFPNGNRHRVGAIDGAELTAYRAEVIVHEILTADFLPGFALAELPEDIFFNLG